MAWNQKELMDIKNEFITKALSKNIKFTHLCKEYGISRKTGYKWLNRFNDDNHFGLIEISRRLHVCPNRISSEMIELIISKRKQYTWGGKKLRQVLINEGYEHVPCIKTCNRILKRFDLVDPIESDKRKAFIRFEKESPNELWQMDFKGHFKLPEGRCHPLTILDDHSRFNICLKACISEDLISVKNALIEAFRAYGLPDAMTMDNGSPWKGSAPHKLSRLTVWLMRLEIKVGHSTPYHPQTQGKDERFHRSLKDEVLKYNQFINIQDTQDKFNDWRHIYNNIRPHEGINMKCPINRYVPSKRIYPEKLPPLLYDNYDHIRRVDRSGLICFKDVRYFIGEHLYGENVALKEISDGVMDIYFSLTKIKRIDLRIKQ